MSGALRTNNQQTLRTLSNQAQTSSAPSADAAKIESLIGKERQKLKTLGYPNCKYSSEVRNSTTAINSHFENLTQNHGYTKAPVWSGHPVKRPDGTSVL